MKKILVFAALTLFSVKLSAQTVEQTKSTFYINVFINEHKDIRIESDLVEFEEVSEEVKKRIYEQPFTIDEKSVIYRIFADDKLKLGYIMDVEQKMFDAYSQNTKRERYLLNTVEMKIDGQNYLQKLEGIKIDKAKG